MTIIPIPRVSHPWHLPLAVDLSYARLAWGTTCRSLVISSWAVLLRTSRQSGLSSRHAWHETRASWLYLDRTFQLCSSTSEVDMQGWFNCRIQSWHREHKTYTEWSIATILQRFHPWRWQHASWGVRHILDLFWLSQRLKEPVFHYESLRRLSFDWKARRILVALCLSKV